MIQMEDLCYDIAFKLATLRLYYVCIQVVILPSVLHFSSVVIVF